MRCCDRRGWEVAEVYVDNDVSAYSGKPRPAWQRLIADIEAGRIDAVVGWTSTGSPGPQGTRRPHRPG